MYTYIRAKRCFINYTEYTNLGQTVGTHIYTSIITYYYNCGKKTWLQIELI